MKLILLTIAVLLSAISCNKAQENSNDLPTEDQLVYGGDFSIMKKNEDLGGQYKSNGKAIEGFRLFKDNGYSWCRLRIFHTPDMEGPVCNNLKYTISLAQKASQYGFKIFLDFHYSDTWTDPGKQFTPAAWKNLDFAVLTDSVYQYTKNVMTAMKSAGVFPEMVQIGNEINNGMLWPHGKLWDNSGNARWDELTTLLKAGIRGVKDVHGGADIPIVIHAATGGNLVESDNFYSNMLQRGVNFDVIGLSYYPWWHGTFEDLEKNLQFLSNKYTQEISIVETAYFANGWYPEPSKDVLDVQPFPPTEQGQYDFLKALNTRLQNYPKVTSVYYWKPDGLEIPGSGIPYLGRSLFDRNGNAFKGISAWKTEN
ncbi:arabinogalactan endo-1,4-beta-galactosidase [Mariniphaga anaerophila]|uniref:Arabinogalactan endo-beta-1,4-galactanase n=1 Tax=Mariniphaga anaerophila TaxID=1484053 RepID=A0A1M5AQR8_9BACT|nr:glycosyl hydrolase 53 family protein [Mariniphaga anaerophila]SHF32447.1 arabinogalactan endo-1,4-beta-galactosidase [Mariniphaga anaerophila]